MVGGGACAWLGRCCREAIALSLRYSNWIVLMFGVVLFCDSLYLLGEEKGGFLGWVVLFFGAFSIIAGGFGVLLSKQGAETSPFQMQCYLCLLLTVAVPQLSVGAYFVMQPAAATQALLDSCKSFEQHTFNKANSDKESCPNQIFCTSKDACRCDCDERCRFCQYDIRESEEYYLGHHQASRLYHFQTPHRRRPDPNCCRGLE